jgi:hypothetical protein
MTDSSRYVGEMIRVLSNFPQIFFNDLESHHSMLDALSHQVDHGTRQHYLTTHTRLVNTTHIIQDKASLRGQQLEQLVQQWIEFEERFQVRKIMRESSVNGLYMYIKQGPHDAFLMQN